VGRTFVIGFLIGLVLGNPAWSVDPSAAVELVDPIQWKRFHSLSQADEDYRRAAQLLSHSARGNVAWAPGSAQRIERDWSKLTGRQNHDVIRPACAAACALAVALKTGMYDPQVAGVACDEATARTIRLIRAVATAHNRASWKYPWQSALWASTFSQAAWLLWEDLDPATRRLMASIVEFEADRFLAPGYRVPYWNGKGGDTKAEENAWNSMVLQMAVAMMPQHPHSRAWRTMCSELMVSAYARPSDRQLTTVLDGRPARQWLQGYNAREDGSVLNHGFMHPDYMCCVALSLRAYLTQSLAGGPVPECTDFGATAVYRNLASHRWPSPPSKPPGGTIYVPGRAEVYYPEGTDWYPDRIDHFYLLDTYVHVLGWDSGGPPAQTWMRLRAEKLLERQSRTPDRCVYAPGEFTRYPKQEQEAAWLVSDAFLLHWLRSNGGLSKKGNWLAAK
jgi:hypothetical protein